MFSKVEMIEIAKKYIKEMDFDGIETVLLLDDIIEKPYGCIFSYDNKKFIETGDFLYAIAGNAPFLVENETSKVIIFGTFMPTEFYIEQYENGTYVPALYGIWEPTDED